jgi:hypothetical protein
MINASIIWIELTSNKFIEKWRNETGRSSAVHAMKRNTISKNQICAVLPIFCKALWMKSFYGKYLYPSKDY